MPQRTAVVVRHITRSAGTRPASSIVNECRVCMLCGLRRAAHPTRHAQIWLPVRRCGL